MVRSGLNMAENIFTLGSVGNFYNDHFVCLKIDAETGEGVELAKKYEVASFPTFVFVNPKTEKAIHISGSIKTGKLSFSPELRPWIRKRSLSI